MKLEEFLIPTRFLCLMGHLVAVLLAWSSTDANIRAALPNEKVADQYETQYSDHKKNYEAALVMAIIAFSIEFLGLFSGVSLFQNQMNTIMIALHFTGAMLVTWFISDEWDFRSFWYIAVFFNFVPATLEVIHFLRVIRSKSKL